MAVRPRHRESWRRCCSARLALWGFLWVDTAGFERLSRLGAILPFRYVVWELPVGEIAGQERKRMDRFCRPLPYHLATAPEEG